MPKPIKVGKKERMTFSKINEVGKMPNLIEIQTKSYNWFIEEGLREVFEDISPIRDYADNLILEFIDYSLIIMHVSNTYAGLAANLAQNCALVTEGTLPLLYAGAMLVDAIAALRFGHFYDKIGVKALMISTLLSSVFAVFVFSVHSTPMLLIGIALWGIGMGAQESILKAVVTSMVPKHCRATGYGIFECAFGVFWFLGSWIMGVLYDLSIPAMVAVSVIAQLSAISLYLASDRKQRAQA